MIVYFCGFLKIVLLFLPVLNIHIRFLSHHHQSSVMSACDQGWNAHVLVGRVMRLYSLTSVIITALPTLTVKTPWQLTREISTVKTVDMNGEKLKKPRGFMQSCFPFLCIINVVVIFYYIFLNVQLLWLLHSISPSP